MSLFNHKHHFFGHMHHKKHQHRLVITIIGFVVLFGLTLSVATYFDMNKEGILPLGIVFILVGWMMHILFDRE